MDSNRFTPDTVTPTTALRALASVCSSIATATNTAILRDEAVAVEKLNRASSLASFQRFAKQAFTAEWNANKELLSAPVMDSETAAVNDGYLTDSTRIMHFAVGGTSFDINLTSLYSAAVKLHMTSSAENIKALPTLFLLALYGVLYTATDSEPSTDETESPLWENMNVLHDVAEMICPAPSGVVAPANVMPGVGDMSGIMGMVSGLFGGMFPNEPNKSTEISNAICGMGSIVKTLVDKASEADETGNTPQRPEEIIARLGAVLQTPEVKEQISTSAAAASTLFGDASASSAAADTVVDSSPTSDVADKKESDEKIFQTS